jgi:hypothetical protein
VVGSVLRQSASHEAPQLQLPSDALAQLASSKTTHGLVAPSHA